MSLEEKALLLCEEKKCQLCSHLAETATREVKNRRKESIQDGDLKKPINKFLEVKDVHQVL
ncbi:hypothetical protein E2C01_076832 [Portunus trituberculatus]|uniref:Uncharacterized protein n=1 Tax=Portunus trituberculatus TaxID=210409 RepID=A0A5B7IPQ8_PORTR|nr:hypothetical protein [Portunus trituberculatus]